MHHDPLQYSAFLPKDLIAQIQGTLQPVLGVPELYETKINTANRGLESPDAFRFLCKLIDHLEHPLRTLLKQREVDRAFIDQRTKACYELNQNLGIDFLDPTYHTILGQEDAQGRIVIGPKNDFYAKNGYGKPIAPVPDYLKGPHVTLFGPPDDAKLSINAMNAYHRKLKNEPSIVSEILAKNTDVPMWGADDEDSKTPMRGDLIQAGINLTGCLDHTIKLQDPASQKSYQLASDHLAKPIKRFPGLALPCSFLFYRDRPVPLHLYDFALHAFQHWNNPEALCFYVPKLENEEEARYIKQMIEFAEQLIKDEHPSYQLGTIRLMIVLENPRAIFRVNEILDELHPYFVGASLGWHDFLASTARLFKNDANYRIPVKADPNIVIKYIKASHDLLANVVGTRGGIKVGGMYGVLPIDQDTSSDSFQITIRGFIKDVITQMKRDLTGFWVAHPDFIRIGMVLVTAYGMLKNGDKKPLEQLVCALLDKKYHEEILRFIYANDMQGLDTNHPRYARSLIVADLKESDFIPNHHPDEVRYNVFQSLQYLTDWLCGNGCVALPSHIENVPVRVMDDLATAERSRWEVWHEVHHGRITAEEVIKIAYEESLFIRKNKPDSEKIVQVKWDERTSKWYPIALELMLELILRPTPVEFATELLIPFTVEAIRDSENPWQAITKIIPNFAQRSSYLKRFEHYFSICGCVHFAKTMAAGLSPDATSIQQIIQTFTVNEIIDAAFFHGDIGESKAFLDAMAAREQALVSQEPDATKLHLQSLGEEYLKRFGFKYLVSAKGKTASQLLQNLEDRLKNPVATEIVHARQALLVITLSRLENDLENSLHNKLSAILDRHQIKGLQVAYSDRHAGGSLPIQTIALGDGITAETHFQIASLSKTIASAYCIEYFNQHNITLTTSVNDLLRKSGSTYQIPNGDAVQIQHLINHQALNMHYVNGIPLSDAMPKTSDLLNGHEKYGYVPVGVLNPPGTKFQYSGAGFLILEHLMERLMGASPQEFTRPFIQQLGLKHLSFEQKNLPNTDHAIGYLDSGEPVTGTRKMFPAFAAGAQGTAHDMLQFLQILTSAYHQTDRKKSFGDQTPTLSHNTAVQMLFDRDKSSQEFMGVNIGLGVFIADAGQNRFAIHQGANDGFRCLYVHCFKGPDQGAGFVIFCNGDKKAVHAISEVAQTLLRALKLDGVCIDSFKNNFLQQNIPAEELVNQGYKELIFSAFEPDLPEKIIIKGPIDALAAYNLAVGASVVSVSDQRFALAENLVSPHEPIFDPSLFGRQGKIMDSWETVRHNRKPNPENPYDFLELKLQKPCTIKFISLSTAYHLGNQVPVVKIEAKKTITDSWTVILPKTPLEGHSIKKIVLQKESTAHVYQYIRICAYPDGGLSRLGLFDDSLPIQLQKEFLPPDHAKSITCHDPIPQTHKPLTPKYIAAAPIEDLADVASLAAGAKIIRATNEHYSPAVQVISPYPPLNMFDGMESARSRKPGHSEEVVIEFRESFTLRWVKVDFSCFRNNNPYELSLDGFEGTDETQPICILPKMRVKEFAGNTLDVDITRLNLNLLKQKFLRLKVTVYPDGGINRIRAYSVNP